MLLRPLSCHYHQAMGQKVLQPWGGGALTQGGFLEAAYTWTPGRAGGWQLKGQRAQDPEAGAAWLLRTEGHLGWQQEG